MTNIDACKRITQMDKHKDKGITHMNILEKELPR